MIAHAINRPPAPIQIPAPPAPVPKTKVRAPDPFDGTEPKKLRAFLVQCQINFADRPAAFATDQAKVNFAMSHLKGIALDWFEPYYLEAPDPNIPPPAFLTDYNAFAHELRSNFGPADPIGTAESELEALVMKENQKIAKYVVTFNRLATQVQWDNNALRHSFYRGLPNRIKDQIANVGKPDTLQDLRTLAQNIDHRYWERKSELNRESKPESSSGKSGSNKSSSKDNSSKSGSSGSKSASSASTPSKPKSDISHLLDGGKLTEAERQRRIKEKLCMYCGTPGHTAKDCRKKASNSKAKGRAAEVSTSTTPEKPEK